MSIVMKYLTAEVYWLTFAVAFCQYIVQSYVSNKKHKSLQDPPLEQRDWLNVNLQFSASNAG